MSVETRQIAGKADPNSLGNLLLEHDLITHAELASALSMQFVHDIPIGEAIIHVTDGRITPAVIAAYLESQTIVKSDTQSDRVNAAVRIGEVAAANTRGLEVRIESLRSAAAAIVDQFNPKRTA